MQYNICRSIAKIGLESRLLNGKKDFERKTGKGHYKTKRISDDNSDDSDDNDSDDDNESYQGNPLQPK